MFKTPPKESEKSGEDGGGGEDGDSWKVAGGRGEDLTKVWTAPETGKDMCGTCESRVNSGQMGLNCDLCSHWYHAECEGIRKKEYEMVNKIGQKVQWYCRKCTGEPRKMKEENKRLRAENKKLSEANKEMKEMIEELTRRVESIEDRCHRRLEEEVEKTRQSVARMVKQVTSEALGEYKNIIEANRLEIENIRKTKINQNNVNETNEEIRKELEKVKNEIDVKKTEEEKNTKGTMKQMNHILTQVEEIERERRKNNIVIFNLQEPNGEDGTERYREDEEKCGKIFIEELGVQDLRIEKLIRLGKKSENLRRPLLVKLGSDDEKKTVLKVASKLRNSKNFERLYIARDMTASEREKEKKLRAELIQRKRQGESEIIIRRGKIIRIEKQLQQEEASQEGENFP